LEPAGAGAAKTSGFSPSGVPPQGRKHAIQDYEPEDLRAFCAVRGMSCLRPLNPLRLDTPPVLETSQDSGLNGRASQHAIILRCAPKDVVFARLIRPSECERVKEDEFGFQPIRVMTHRHSMRHSSLNRPEKL